MNFTCPWCEGVVEVQENEINCGIFRHAVLKNNFQQINPHASQKECEQLVNDNLIFGCGKPFKIVKNEYKYSIDKCDYI